MRFIALTFLAVVLGVLSAAVSFSGGIPSIYAVQYGETLRVTAPDFLSEAGSRNSLLHGKEN